MLESLVNEAEFHHIEKMLIGGIGEAKRIIEQQIIRAARVVVSGEPASEAALGRARLVLERTRETELAKQEARLNPGTRGTRRIGDDDDHAGMD